MFSTIHEAIYRVTCDQCNKLCAEGTQTEITNKYVGIDIGAYTDGRSIGSGHNHIDICLPCYRIMHTNLPKLYPSL